MIQGIYVIGLIVLLIVIYFIIPEMTIIPAAATGSTEGFINIPKPVTLPVVQKVADSEGESLPSAPFYGIAEDRPLPPIDPADQPATLVRLRRLLERLETFFMTDYKSIEDKVEYLQALTNAKALIPRLREEIHFLDANPGMPPTLTTKKLLEGEATASFLERSARTATINEIEAYTNFQEGKPVKEGFQASLAKTRATLKDLVDFNVRAWAEIKRLGASGTTDPVTNARINSIKKIRESIQRIIDDIKQKNITEYDIPVFKEDLERAFPLLADKTVPIPNIFEGFELPPELEKMAKKLETKDINKLIRAHIKDTLSSTGIDINKKEKKTFEPFDAGKKFNLTFTNTNGSEEDVVAVEANDNEASTKQTKYNPTLDWKTRTKQICEQVRMRGMDPRDFGCLTTTDEVSPTYSWRGHAKMVCSRLESTPDPALPVTCGCPPANWSGWNSDVEFEN